MLSRLRIAFAILFLFTLVELVADALEAITEDRQLLRDLDVYQRAHIDEASVCSARVWDLLRYVRGEGPRVEDIDL